jgi:hypothetical protein
MEAQELVERLIAALRESGFPDEVDRLTLNLHKLLHGSQAERTEAAELIIGLCHVKAYGDLNISFNGEGRNPLLDHLAAIKRAVAKLSNNSFNGDGLGPRH